jgi:disulfide bond formation protein DsbB
MSPRREDRRYTFRYILGTIISCIFIISSLAAFTILSVKYLYISTDLQRDAHQYINTSTIVARQVACVLPRSGHYCVYQRFIYYILLLSTIIITVVFKQDHGLWLASGAAITALSYSGVAAVHQMLIFGSGLRTQRHSICESFPLPGSNDILPVCHGLDDLDRDTACTIVGAGLLAILPMAAWSQVFKQAAAKPILVLWTLFMSSSHVFCAVSKTETTVHYQICPRWSGRGPSWPRVSGGAADRSMAAKVFRHGVEYKQRTCEWRGELSVFMLRSIRLPSQS